jgi:hypothetical protein
VQEGFKQRDLGDEMIFFSFSCVVFFVRFGGSVEINWDALKCLYGIVV